MLEQMLGGEETLIVVSTDLALSSSPTAPRSTRPPTPSSRLDVDGVAAGDAGADPLRGCCSPRVAALSSPSSSAHPRRTAGGRGQVVAIGRFAPDSALDRGAHRPRDDRRRAVVAAASGKRRPAAGVDVGAPRRAGAASPRSAPRASSWLHRHAHGAARARRRRAEDGCAASGFAASLRSRRRLARLEIEVTL